MRGAVYLLCGLVGGLAGGLLVDFLRDEPAARTGREVRRAVSDTPSREEFANLSERIRRLEREGVSLDGPVPVDAEEDTPPATPTATPDGEGEGPKTRSSKARSR